MRPGKAGAGRWWPVILVGVIGIHAATWIGFTLIAAHDPSFSVEPEHYKKSLDWDRSAAEMRASDALGWQAQVSVEGEPSVHGERRVLCRLTDREGRVVAGATVDAVMFSHARGNERLQSRFTEEPSGVYAALVPMARAGLWEMRISARRGDELFREVVYVTVPEGR